MKFLDLFSGIGGFRLGLERAGHKPVGYVEIDKYARQSYEVMYDTTGEWTATDITKVTNEEWGEFNGKVELIAGGFPCQAFSVAGKRKGFFDETRGTLFFEIARAIKQIKPQFVLLENVKGLLNHAGGDTFRTILSTFDELGYDVEWRVFNSKNFGVPQNRERVYIVGHLRGSRGREVLSLFREDGEVNPAVINDLTDLNSPRHGRRGNVLGVDGISPALAATDYKQPKLILENPVTVEQVGNISDSSSFGGNSQVGRVYSTNSISPTLNTMQGGGREPKIAMPVLSPDRINKSQNGRRFKQDGEPSFTITATDRHSVLVREATKKGYDIATVGDSINVAQPNSKTRRGRVGHGIANTLTTSPEQATLSFEPKPEFGRLAQQAVDAANSHNVEAGDCIEPFNYRVREDKLTGIITTRPEGLKTAMLPEVEDDYELRIRKLTPRECWRLQAFPDDLFDKAQGSGMSDSQLYKQAGNSVTVNVIEYIGHLLYEQESNHECAVYNI